MGRLGPSQTPTGFGGTELQLLCRGASLQVIGVLPPGLGQARFGGGHPVLGGAQRSLGRHRVGADRVSAELLQPGDRLRRGGVAASCGCGALHLLLQTLSGIGDRHDLGLADAHRGGERVAVEAEPA